MANQFLGLSLFIMLLSFFIILNAVSDFDPKKSAPILNSLSAAFSVEDPTLVEISDTPSDRSSDETGTTLDRIQGLFSAHIVGVEAKQNRLGTVLRIRMPFEEFQREVLSSLSRSAQQNPEMMRGTKGFFLSTLVSLVDTGGDDHPYKMDMVVFVGEDNDERSANARMIAEIAQKIERAGLPRKMLSAGVSGGDKGIVDLYFRPYSAFDTDAFRQGATRG